MIALSIGKASYNVTIPMDKFPEENSKVVVNEKLEESGGSGLLVAYQLGKWNYETYFAGTVGYDDFSNIIRKDLEGVGVHPTYLELNYEKKTTTTFILVSKSSTSRTQIMIEPEVYHLKKSEFDIQPNVIYTDGYEYSATMAAFNKFPNCIKVLGAGLNYSNEKEVVALAKYATYIIFSLELACKVTSMKVDPKNSAHLLNLYKELKNLYPRNEIVVTLKADGVLYSVNGEVKYMPTIPVKEVDRTGAGDVFDATFVYGIGHGYDIEKCMRLANIAAGLSTTKYGAKASIPLVSEVVQYYESKFGPLEVGEQVATPSPAPQAAPTELPATTNTPETPANNPSKPA